MRHVAAVRTTLQPRLRSMHAAKFGSLQATVHAFAAEVGRDFGVLSIKLHHSPWQVSQQRLPSMHAGICYLLWATFWLLHPQLRAMCCFKENVGI